MNSKTAWLILGLSGLLVSGCGIDKPEEVVQAEKSLPKSVDFNLHVKPILSDRCYACHGPDLANQKAGLRLDTPEGAFTALEESGNTAIVPGEAARSELVHRILSEDKEELMPPPESNLTLTDYEKAVLIRWVEEGAEYKKHWAFIPPEKPEVPETFHQTQAMNEIDHFIFRTLERNDLQPQAEADKETLIRRVSFDLTGLPPTLEEIDAFLTDDSEGAYEKVVNRLLASPHYGEKMATDWMDASRYADTHGYSVDRYRPMWPWRDWVIKAFNENKPFNQFVTWQLAGDLMPEPTREQILATAFNRNHAQNMEGGIVNEEFRIEYVADRTNTLGKSLMAMTLECARCHDHKFDPISQKEYFQMFSFFNNIDEAGQISWDDAMPVPTLLLTDEKQDSIMQFLDEQIDQKKREISALVTHKSESIKFEQPVNIEKYLNDGLIAHFDFETAVNNQFANVARPSQKAQIILAEPRKNPEALEPSLEEGKFGQALLSNGDDPLSLGSIGAFDRAQPFTIGLWMQVPTALKNGTIFHKGQGKIIYNFRGYYLSIKDNKIDALMAHTWPYNNISKHSTIEIPKDEWFHLALTYDGSSKAQGLKVYLNGEAMEMEAEKDNLYKDILLSAVDEEPGLSFGALWRGTGTKNALLDEIKVYDRELLPAEVAAWSGKKELDQQTQQALASVHANLGYWQKKKELQKLRTEQNALVESVPEIMVMDELEEPRPTFLLDRGAYDAPSEEVHPATPESILTFPDTLPQNRLGLAQWLFSEHNPLTARVIVNRYWQSYFGRGIVSSAADFGNQGELPTHPELLDWLAIRFVESGWDIKAMQKMIVLSATYRQSSQTPQELLEKDYDNKLISRGPSLRLTAEMLRDNVLHASGLLVDKIGGESVKPYQPDGLWKISGASYVPDTGEKLYRRSLYTLWKRTVPPPSMNTFDAPTRSYCEVTRQKTSTPLQSLVLLNDPQFVEASRALAAKVLTTESNHKTRLTNLYRSLTAKFPSEQELTVLNTFYRKQKNDFQESPEKMTGWLATGEFEAEPCIDKQALAAYTVVASTVMNADATVMKR
ncbi:DUF1553 domain-containing protein [Tunicatimonas pelagia]|uniref:DUF1553 domain-containing protein n=1 Tax=Tunicatimonas pelagia TaxID=931531 RepID=UPI002666B3DA|nr:DUF1553 domain-containing protein [Tunicatimonas pelagia]WKN41157.1 DUF1553 domain-containing protein [Tunicatimonas pelagia]